LQGPRNSGDASIGSQAALCSLLRETSTLRVGAVLHHDVTFDHERYRALSYRFRRRLNTKSTPHLRHTTVGLGDHRRPAVAFHVDALLFQTPSGALSSQCRSFVRMPLLLIAVARHALSRGKVSIVSWLHFPRNFNLQTSLTVATAEYWNYRDSALESLSQFRRASEKFSVARGNVPSQCHNGPRHRHEKHRLNLHLELRELPRGHVWPSAPSDRQDRGTSKLHRCGGAS
jgi:hypothetical protein